MKLRLALVVTVGVALALAATAPAHNPKPGAPPCAKTYPWRSKVTSIKPAVPELNAFVLFCDDKLLLQSTSAKTVVVLGYEGEQYLKLQPGGVWGNALSPTMYLNQSREDVAPPASANARAKPRWIKMADSRLYAWHDHRIHWMLPTKPAVVKKDPAHPHRVFDWQVPLLFGGKRVVIHGALFYKPPPR